MRLLRFLRTHVDSVVALALAAGYLLAVYQEEGVSGGQPFIEGLGSGSDPAMVAGALFLLSLAVRTRAPIVPLGLAIVALTLVGRGTLEGSLALALGSALAAYSVGAWSGGWAAVIGALGVGILAGLIVLRSADETIAQRDIAASVLVLIGPWLLGLLLRSARVARHDPRVTDGSGWPWTGGSSIPDSAGRDDTVRELREVNERALSTIILGARDAERAMERDPRGVRRALATIEAAGTDALEETQRLTGLLLSPDGTPPPEAQPGLADVDFLAEEVSKAGLPVAMRVEGRPLPLTPDLDAVAYRVIHEALMATLHGSTDAEASVVVRYEPDELRIEVVDDGVSAGDDPAEETAGLLAARKEVASLGGTLDAGPGEGRGYWVVARLPYEPDWS